MRTYPKHLKPTKRNQRKMEKAIEAAKRQKRKEAALMAKYEQQAAKMREKADKAREKAFKNAKIVTPTAHPPKAAAPVPQPRTTAPVQPSMQPPVQKPITTPPAPVIEWEDEEPEKRRGGVFFTVAGIVFLLIAIGMTLWQFGFLDKFLQKPVSDKATSAVSVVELSEAE